LNWIIPSTTRIANITIDMALITVFTMIFVALVALVNISNNPELDK